MTRTLLGAALALGFAMLGACGASAKYNAGANVDNGAGGTTVSGSGGATGGSSGTSACTTAAECPLGYTCDFGACVPPETETNRGLDDSPPVATPHYVFALNPTAASVARIDPTSLAIEAVPVGPGPVALASMPGEDAALALSFDDASLSLVDSRTLPSKVTRIPLKRQYARLTVSPDGAWAAAWPSPTVAPSSGAEGIFALVDLVKARAGAPAAQVVTERAGGYRITNVLFRVDGSVATRLHVFSKASVSTFDLTQPAAPLPVRLALPASMAADVSSREIAASADGHVIVLRSTTAPELASFDGQAITLAPLAEVATDLDLLPDGTAAVAALRGASAVAYIRIPQDLAPDSGMQLFPVDGGVVGQVALPPVVPDAGMFAFVYSTVTTAESFARIDLPSGAVTHYPLEKLVDEIGVSPDAKSAIVLHRANPATTASDPYEAAVDKDQGYSVFDVQSGFWQLKRTGVIKPTRYAWSPRGGYAGVALRDDGNKRFFLDAVNLGTLVSTALPLASAPLFMGTVPEAPGITPHRVFVSQDHPAGRISVIQLDTKQVRTATGFTLNAEIQ